MIYTILLTVILAQAGLLAWFDYNNRKERKSLLNMINAKNTQEFVSMELADKTEIKAKPKIESDYVNTDSLSDEEWEKVAIEYGKK